MSIRSILLAIAISAGVVAPALAADFVVIVNKANDNAIDKNLVAKFYLGESKAWPNGGSVVPYDLPQDKPLRAAFDNEVVGKSPGSLKSLWTQNVFTGKALPPKSAPTDEDVRKAVAANKNAIGYVKAGSVDDTVKAAFR